MKEIKFYYREDEYGFLSNFDRTPFDSTDPWGNPYTYKTNEHRYHAHMASIKSLHDIMAEIPHAVLAMAFGRELVNNPMLTRFLREDHCTVTRIKIMKAGLRDKFKVHSLRQRLLDTGDAKIMEDARTDFFWGICDGTGQNWLGRLLMQVRDEIRDEDS